MSDNVNGMKKDKIIAELNFILTDGQESYLSTIQNINDYFLSLITPKNLDGGSKDNILVNFQVNFSELCIALMTNNVPDPEKMTVFRFYSAIKFFEDKKTKQPKIQK